MLYRLWCVTEAALMETESESVPTECPTDGGHTIDSDSIVVIGGAPTVAIDELAAPTDTTDCNATTSAHGFLPKLGGGTTNYLRADGTWAAPPGGSSTLAGLTDTAITGPAAGSLLVNDGFGKWVDLGKGSNGSALVVNTEQDINLQWGNPTAAAHAASHRSGGADSIKLDDLAATDDNTDLDASTSKHGLLPKLGGGSVNFLRADGTWNAPPGGTDDDAIHDNVSGEVNAVTEKASPVSADLLLLEDSAASYAKKKVQVGNLPGSGETNTAANVGTAGVGVYKTKVGAELQFKKINAGSTKVTVTDDTGNDEVDVDVAPENIAHADLSGAGTNNHAAIDDHIADSANPHGVKLDDLGVPDDNTDLDASTSKHGLLKKLGGGTTNFLRADGTWAAPPGGGGGHDIDSFVFTFSTTTTDSDPGTGYFRCNNATEGASTFLYFDYYETNAATGAKLALNILSTLRRGDFICVQEKADRADYLYWRVTGEVIDATGYVKIPVALYDGGTSGFTNDEELIVNFIRLRFPAYHFFADQMSSPNSDYTVTAIAPAAPDSNDAGLIVRLFDDTTEEGVGMMVRVPVGATYMVFRLGSRADVAPGTAKGVKVKIYFRKVHDNVAVGSWSSAEVFETISIPTNEYFQYDVDDFTAGYWTAGGVVQLELTRAPADAADTLVGDWALLDVEVTFG